MVISKSDIFWQSSDITLYICIRKRLKTPHWLYWIYAYWLSSFRGRWGHQLWDWRHQFLSMGSTAEFLTLPSRCSMKKNTLWSQRSGKWGIFLGDLQHNINILKALRNPAVKKPVQFYLIQWFLKSSDFGTLFMGFWLMSHWTSF